MLICCASVARLMLICGASEVRLIYLLRVGGTADADLYCANGSGDAFGRSFDTDVLRVGDSIDAVLFCVVCAVDADLLSVGGNAT